MSPWIRLACIIALLLMGLAPAVGSAALRRAQGPDLPRLRGICLLTDGPQRGWASYTAALGVRLSHPPEWSPRETAGRRMELVAADHVMVRLREVDTRGLAPSAWLQERVRTREAARCRVVALGSFRGHQCFDSTARMWTTYLTTSHRVLAFEVPGTLAREIHCGILMSIEDLSRQ